MKKRASTQLDIKYLKSLKPLDQLSFDALNEILNKSTVEELPSGRTLFRQGEKDKLSYYLVLGQIELTNTDNTKAKIIKAKTQQASHPIAQLTPRPSTARTKAPSTLLSIDTDLLEILLQAEDNPSGEYVVKELGTGEETTDWMLRFLQSSAFLQLPTSNIQKLLLRMEEIPAKKGDAIIRQGSSDDYYYIVKEGKCAVSRRPAPKADDIQLAILVNGDGFGEEALITNGNRNATVTMLEDGVLMRLTKEDFISLLIEPLLHFVSKSEMEDKLSTGAALLIDVRSNQEFSQGSVTGAINIPLSMLRIKVANLNPERSYIIYCDSGDRSAAAAFLMIQHGLQCYVLEDGIDETMLPPQTPVKSAQPVKTSAKEPQNFQKAAAHNKPEQPAITANLLKLPVVAQSTAEKTVNAHRKLAQEEAHRAAVAERARKEAEEKTRKLQQEAEAVRKQTKSLASKTQQAEEARRKAEKEIERLRSQEIARRDKALRSAKERVEEETLRAHNAEQARHRAEQEAAHHKAEAEAAHLKAEQELEKIRAQVEETTQHQTDLTQAQQQAAEIAKQSKAVAAEAEQEAERIRIEAEAIRREALKEAEQLRAEMEAAREQIEQQVAQAEAKHKAHQIAAMKDVRQRAENAVRQAAQQARQQAELEAEAIRREAFKSAQKAAQETIRLSSEKARQQAELEAETIHREALLSAQQQAEDAIKQQILETRKQAEIENETLRQKTLLEAQQQADEELKQHTLETRQQAEIEAETIRREALQEAESLREELQATRIEVAQAAALTRAKLDEEAQIAEEIAAQLAEEQARIKHEEEIAAAVRLAETQFKAQKELEIKAAEQFAKEQEKLRIQASLAQRPHAKPAHSETQAKELAEAIIAKLEEAEQARQAEERHRNSGKGISLSKSHLRHVEGRTILEDEEDIFIFQPPKKTQGKDNKSSPETPKKTKSTKDELPSFIVEPISDALPNGESSVLSGIVPEAIVSAPQSTSYEHLELDDETRQGGVIAEKRRPLVAIAASLVLAFGVGMFALTSETFINVDKVIALVEPKEAIAEDAAISEIKDRRVAKITSPAISRSEEEARIRDEANSEFAALLAKWKIKLTAKPAANNPAQNNLDQ